MNDDDHPHDECGVFGTFGLHEAANLTVFGLHALQHRGQEAAGIISYDDGHFRQHRGMGEVLDNFGDEAVMRRLTGTQAIGHVRYGTSGESSLRNVQPLFGDFAFGGMALAHNGNLTNALSLRKRLVERGCLFQSTTDTEVIIHLVATSRANSVTDRLIDALNQLDGAYSLVAMTKDTLYGVRDPYGIRPLVLGELDGSYVLASETCALDIIGAAYIRDVEPGELVVIDANGLKSLSPFSSTHSRFCVFEYIYFARPDSTLQGINVYQARKRIGEELARESHVDADLVVPVPDSGVPAALGYANESNIPFELGIIRNHYVGRTFIQPTDATRHIGVKRKHNANANELKGKRVILVDDSIVRGTTSTKIVDMVRQAGAAEVHLRISSPPTAFPCFYGIDTPEKEKLLAHKHDVASMEKLLGVDSLAFISIDGLYRAAGEEKRNSNCPQFCDACFTGEYPVSLTDQVRAENHRVTNLTEKG
jgi:amidophosphoribosyltransferase